ncbi:MAG: thiamine pyrophosphate-dependent dehydrogenase E1 component subunit alpha [Chloroflexota bacterium]
MYKTMLRIRQFDDRIVRLFNSGRISGALHSYVGEEGVAAGVCSNLRPDDYMVSTHRGHGHMLAKGSDMDRMMAELFAKETGYCHGKGGSMHIVDMGLGILGSNGIVGAGIPIASGAGTAIKVRGTDQVVACHFGDGASNTGAFHEGINLAGVWQLPVIFVIENNLYAQFTPQSMHTKVIDLSLRGQGYDIPALTVDGNDALAVAEAAREAIARARAGKGPTILECKTFRWFGHAINNPGSNLGRNQDEIAAWKEKDPIPRFARALLERSVVSQADLDGIQQDVEAELERAIEFAEESPEAKPEDALLHVYSELPEGCEL